MAKKKRKRTGPRRSRTRRRTSTTAMSSRGTTRRRTTRRRKKGFLHDTGKTLMTIGKGTLSGAAGGAAYGAVTAHFKPSVMVKTLGGVAIAMGFAYFGMPFMGAGLAGATGSDAAKEAMTKFGLADGMTDVEYVDADSLSDSGYDDENGNAIVMDDDGIMYRLADDGDGYEAIGDAYSLQDGYALENGYALEDVGNYQLLPAYID